MHDDSLGPDIDVGAYDGPVRKNGLPLHSGNCTDGVFGCRKCSNAMRHLPPGELIELGLEVESTCDWCRKVVPVGKLGFLRPWDEPSVTYEVCLTCRHAYNVELAQEFTEEDD